MSAATSMRSARAVADVTTGMLLASIDIKASPERVFRALASDPPKKLVQTWAPKWIDGPVTTVTYLLTAIEGSTRITVRHEGFGDASASCEGHAAGWERVFTWLATWMEQS